MFANSSFGSVGWQNAACWPDDGDQIDWSLFPIYSAERNEDADDFLERFERYGHFRGWDEAKFRYYFSIALRGRAYTWFMVNKNSSWAVIRAEFLKTYGKTFVDWDLEGFHFDFERPMDYLLPEISVHSKVFPERERGREDLVDLPRSTGMCQSRCRSLRNAKECRRLCSATA